MYTNSASRYLKDQLFHFFRVRFPRGIIRDEITPDHLILAYLQSQDCVEIGDSIEGKLGPVEEDEAEIGNQSWLL